MEGHNIGAQWKVSALNHIYMHISSYVQVQASFGIRLEVGNEVDERVTDVIYREVHYGDRHRIHNESGKL